MPRCRQATGHLRHLRMYQNWRFVARLAGVHVHAAGGPLPEVPLQRGLPLIKLGKRAVRRAGGQAGRRAAATWP